MKAKDLRAMDEAALNKELQDLLKAQFNLRMQKSHQQLENTTLFVRHAARSPASRTILAQKARRNVRKQLTRTLIGKAISTKMDKTVTVLVERKVKHPIGKIVVKSKKYHVHDENNDVREGDIVEISETRPISRTKSWTVSKIVERAEI